MMNFKKSIALIAAVSLVFASTEIFPVQQNTQSYALSLGTELKKAYPDSRTVYDIIISFKNKYPQDTPWGYNKRYKWKGGIYTEGYGCAAFAFELSDAAFGDLPARKILSYNPNDIQVGDIIRLKEHSFVVLERRTTDIGNGFVIAEGNYAAHVEWDRFITDAEIKAEFLEVLTRYPELAVGDVNADGRIDSSDASLVLADYALVQTGKETSLYGNIVKAADVNSDGKVDPVDASKILEYYSRLSTGKNPSWN